MEEKYGTNLLHPKRYFHISSDMTILNFKTTHSYIPPLLSSIVCRRWRHLNFFLNNPYCFRPDLVERNTLFVQLPGIKMNKNLAKNYRCWIKKIPMMSSPTNHWTWKRRRYMKMFLFKMKNRHVRENVKLYRFGYNEIIPYFSSTRYISNTWGQVSFYIE